MYGLMIGINLSDRALSRHGVQWRWVGSIKRLHTGIQCALSGSDRAKSRAAQSIVG